MNALIAYLALASSAGPLLLEAGFDWLEEWTGTWARMVARFASAPRVH